MHGTPHIPQRLFGDFSGQLSGPFANEEFIRALSQHFHADQMALVHDGRNRLYRLDIPGPDGALKIAVKQFGRSHPWREFTARWKGSKARRSFAAAQALHRAGVGTPPPVGFLELIEGGAARECYYLSGFVEGMVSFRDELLRLLHERPLCRDFMTLLSVVARGVRALHAAGVEHRDLGNQNILLRRIEEDAWAEMMFIDLNRARVGDALGLPERARDVSRLDLPSDLRRVFLEMLFDPEIAPDEFLRAEERARRRFAWHTRTRRLRHPLREARLAAQPRDPCEQMPAPRDLWIWDDRSEQPIPALTSRDRHRQYSWANHLRVARSVLRHADKVRREAPRLAETAFLQPVELRGRFGVAVTANTASLEAERRLVMELPGRPALLARLYHHETEREWNVTLQAMRAWKEAGHPVALALCQDRRAVLQPGRWTYFINHALREASGFADEIEVGHAINRVKWGLWTLDEYARLMRETIEVAGDYPRVRLLGPAVIDFEWHQLAAALDALPAPFRFAGLGHHLYVDRRGAPENRQDGRDLVAKLAVLRAFARRHPRCEDRVVVSEVNWPLVGTGVWSPVGSPYVSPGPRHGDPSVSEEVYARFLARYFLLALGSGLADRVYWWKLAAHGFGLVDPHPETWRRRPAFLAFSHLLRRVGEATMLSCERRGDGVHRLLFGDGRGGEGLQVWWRNGEPMAVEPTERIGRIEDLYGQPVDAASVLPVGPSPIFVHPAGR